MALKNGNTLVRIASIPLFNSAYQIAVFTYTDIKGVHPVVGFFCGVAERSVSTAVGVAVMAATPVMQRLEVPIAAVNSYTLRGVDELEARFPILDQSADEVLGNLRDSLAASMEQLQASTAERVGRLTERASGVVEDVVGVAALGVNIVLNASVVSQALESGVNAALSRVEQIANHYLPATEEETRRQVPSLKGVKQSPESEQTYARQLQLVMATSARRANQRAWSYAEGLWSWMLWALNQLLEFAVELRRRLYRALVALTETGDSDPSPQPGFPQDPIPVRLVQRRRSGLGDTSNKASSDKRSI
ncbi:perilipin-2-like isoform X1 [Malaclemys terrapin pileata]|uniref:perilipin-2-like isoform X1 n=1 Tax=Malaclemys terrapin pileata TaxID=2991368 RepID=UPI0023A906B3|nr:perilipin-2-like isoform X1 [Malaclemys terrapin pileata]